MGEGIGWNSFFKFCAFYGKNALKIGSFSYILLETLMPKIKTICIPYGKNKFAFPVRKIEKVCIPSAKNKKKLHSQWKKWKRFSFPVQKIKVDCIPNAKNKKDLHFQYQKWENLHDNHLQISLSIKPRTSRKNSKISVPQKFFVPNSKPCTVIPRFWRPRFWQPLQIGNLCFAIFPQFWRFRTY